MKVSMFVYTKNILESVSFDPKLFCKELEKALKMLKSQLYELELRKKNEAKQAVESTKKKIEWGSQIRNYVLHPYKLVKDLRTNMETSNAQGVLDGELNPFIKAYLMEF